MDSFGRTLTRHISGHFCIIASEENANPIMVPPSYRPGRYVTCLRHLP